MARTGAWWNRSVNAVMSNKALRSRVSGIVREATRWGQWGYSNARHIGWFLVTSAMITAVPLIFEYNRELQLEEMEKLQISKSLAEGADRLVIDP